ncbi:MAG: pilus assembly protein [Comamonadaceae bacterium]|nr:MAG: pilus assembly protein [Comamonadaceae bacterium]
MTTIVQWRPAIGPAGVGRLGAALRSAAGSWNRPPGFDVPAASAMATAGTAARRRQCQTGAAMTEFIIVLPVFLMVVFAIAEMALMYQAKSVVDLAALAAARAGALDHARNGATSSMHTAGAIALSPLYMRENASNGEVAGSIGRALADGVLSMRIEVLNPTPQSFNDHGINVAGRRVIPNDNLMYRGTTIRAASSQNIQDANLLKIRLTYCYEPKMPLSSDFLASALSPLATARDPFCKLARGRLPITSEAIVRMQSDAWR